MSHILKRLYQCWLMIGNEHALEEIGRQKTLQSYYINSQNNEEINEQKILLVEYL